MIVLFVLLLQYLSLPQLHATRAVRWHSVPIVSCITTGAGAVIRLYGLESMGGVGDLGAELMQRLLVLGRLSMKLVVRYVFLSCL